MSKKEDIYHSVLIVSSSERLKVLVRQSLAGSVTLDLQTSAARARRQVMERYYDLVVVNAPLPDESGEELCLDLSEQIRASILFLMARSDLAEASDMLADHGIYVLPKPLPREQFDKAVRFLGSIQGRIQALERKIESMEEKMEELRLVSRAKILLVEKKHMTEDEAHRLIGMEAMDSGWTRKRVAERIIEDL